MSRGFSFASVVLSFFLVGGGMFTATLAVHELRIADELQLYALLAAGAFVGGFVAARASRGQTILEPAIGAIAVVGAIVGLAAATPLGKLIWTLAGHAEQDHTMRLVGAFGLAGIVGALLGAFLSEKLFGEATRSSIPWLLYTALSAFGACLLAMLLISIAYKGGALDERTSNELGGAVLIGIAVGCLLCGIAVGASARTRPLIAAFLGAGVGVSGFFLLLTRATETASSPSDKNNVLIGLVILAAGGGLVALIGTAIGWAAVGRRHADA
jgi:MFS family permease